MTVQTKQASAALRWGRFLLPGLIWSGAGVVVRKRSFFGGQSGAWASMSYEGQAGFVSGIVPARWVLIVNDSRDREHVVSVDAAVWTAHQVGDEITAENPLVDIG